MQFKPALRLIVLIISIVTTTTFILVNYQSLALTAGLLALLVVCLAQAVLLPGSVASGATLALMALWVGLHWANAPWRANLLIPVSLEIGLLAFTTLLVIRLRRVWQQHTQSTDAEGLMQQFQLAEFDAGLFTRDIGELRLTEEIARAAEFHRPVALMLVEVLPVNESISPHLLAEARQAVVRQLLNLTTIHDVAFAADRNRIGIILPERDWHRLYKDADMIETGLVSLRLTRGVQQSSAITTYVTLNFGLSVYEGSHQSAADLMTRAEKSLQVHHGLGDALETYDTVVPVPAQKHGGNA